MADDIAEWAYFDICDECGAPLFDCECVTKEFDDYKEPKNSRKGKKKMSEKMEITRKKCRTPEFRVSFPHVFEKHSGFEGQEPKYSIVMLIPKSTALKKNYSQKDQGVSMHEAAINAATEMWGPKEKWPKNLRMPFRDGDEKTDLSGYEGHFFVTASSKQKPQVISNKRDEESNQFPLITKEDETFYAGCYARATLIAFAYDKMGNKGISFSLQNVQKLRDGEQFSGRKAAEDEFEEVEDGSDKAENYSDTDTTEDDDQMGMGF